MRAIKECVRAAGADSGGDNHPIRGTPTMSSRAVNPFWPLFLLPDAPDGVTR